MSRLSDLISDRNDPQLDAAPTPGPTDPSSGSTEPHGMGRLTGLARQHPRAAIALIAGVGLALAAIALTHRPSAPVAVVLPPVKKVPAVKPSLGAHAAKQKDVTLLSAASSPAHAASGASAPMKAASDAGAATPTGAGRTAPFGASLVPTQVSAEMSPQAEQAQKDEAMAKQTQARAMFMQASQGSVQLARIQKVQDGLYAVAYVVGGRSGQAWVDVPAKVVFVGQAVNTAGQVLVPGAVAMAQGAVAPAGPGMAKLTGPGSAAAQPNTQASAMAAVVADQQAGFWEGSARAPDKIWAFVDPDNKDSMEFFQEMRPLIRAGQLRAYWIPVGVYDHDSTGKAAFILAQVGQLHALAQNYATFVAHGNRGAAQVDTQSAAMSLRVMQNNDLLTGLGKLELPAVLTCTPQGGITTLYKPSIKDLVAAFGPCSKNILHLAGLPG